MDKIVDVWDSEVKRWHASRSAIMRECGDNTHSHTTRCLILFFSLCPTLKMSTVRCILSHDLAESYTGDTPRQAKQDNAKLSDELKRMEHTWLKRNFVDPDIFSEEDLAWLRIVDQLDGFLMLLKNDPSWINAKVIEDLWKDIDKSLKRLSKGGSRTKCDTETRTKIKNLIDKAMYRYMR